MHERHPLFCSLLERYLEQERIVLVGLVLDELAVGVLLLLALHLGQLGLLLQELEVVDVVDEQLLLVLLVAEALVLGNQLRLQLYYEHNQQ